MNITAEQVRRLCAASGVDEIAALSALERQDGDLLEALLELERQGSADPPAGGGFYSTQGPAPGAGGPLVPGARLEGGTGGEAGRTSRPVFSPADLWRGLKELFHKGRVNRMEDWRSGEQVTAMPLLVLFLLLACFPQIMIPLLLLGLVLGFRYRLAGPDLMGGGVAGARRRAAEALDRAAARARQQRREKKQ